jgi:hypothetical protein
MDPAQIWRTAVALAATKARQTLPDCASRIDKALDLVLNDAVELLEGGKARITSQHNGSKTYTVCNGTCDCPDFARAPQGQCKHRIARGLVIRAMEIAKTMQRATGQVSLSTADMPDDVDDTTGYAREAEPAVVPTSVETAPRTDVSLSHNSLKPYLATIPPTVPPVDDDPAPRSEAGDDYPLSTLSLKFRLSDGIEIGWTLRGDDADVARRLPRALATVRNLQSKGTLLATPAPLALPPASTPASSSKELHDCSWHGPMKESAKAPGTWYCTKKMADGSYCKEVWPKRAKASQGDE